jgi:hypothetical protein
MDWNHRWLLRGILFYFLLVGIILFLVSCQTVAPLTTSSAPFCLTYSPVYWSSHDTRKTIEQTDTNNRVWKQLCASKKQ